MNIIEIAITAIIIITAAILLYKTIKKKAKGECSCESCSSHCPNRKNQETKK